MPTRPPTTRLWPTTGGSADDADCHRTHRQHQRPTPSDAHRDLLEPDAVKAARPVLRGPRLGNEPGLPDGSAPRATPEQAAAAAQGGGRTHLVAGYDSASPDFR